MKALFISRDFQGKTDGGSVVAKRNRKSLELIGYDVTDFVITTPSLSTRVKNILFDESYGDTQKLRKIMKNHLRESYDIVFFDGSCYGGYLKEFIKAGFKTVCFFHNAEAVYYEAKYQVSKKLQDKIMIPYIIKNERQCVEESSYLITINERDSNALKSLYGRGADFVFPTTFDKVNDDEIVVSDEMGEYLLFVGTNFFANQEALHFYINQVAEHVGKKLIVVGNINQAFNNEEVSPNVEFVGKVEALAPYYVNALAVVAPIFSGSGLKTKTVEALRFGKTIIGTNECFEGIPLKDNPQIGYLCNTSEEFINTINNLHTSKKNYSSLNLFNSRFSTESQLLRLQSFFEKEGLM